MITFYVILPENHLKSTVFESMLMGFTDNKFVLDQFIQFSIPLIYSEHADSDYVIYEYVTKNEEELFKLVKREIGYELTHTHEIGIYESVCDDQFALYLTDDYVEDNFYYFDYNFSVTKTLWENMYSILCCEDFLHISHCFWKMVKLLFEKYCTIYAVFLFVGEVGEIENQTFKTTIMESMPIFKSVEHVSIIDLIDSTIVWYLQLIGKLTL